MTQKRTEADRAPSAKSTAQKDRAMDETMDLDFYAPPERLMVPKHPDWIFRWVAEFVQGEYQSVNVQKKLMEKYVRVKMEELPEDFLLYDPTDKRSEQDHFTRFGGLILMRMPRAYYESRRRYYQRISAERLHSANELQGVAGRDAFEEDRGSRAYVGEDAARVHANMRTS
jgi:hypothetical protein